MIATTMPMLDRRLAHVRRFGLLLVPVLVFVTAPARAQTPPMDAFWPNEDGRSWDYHQLYQDWYIAAGD